MIDGNTLLQTDATVIAGLLILVTIYSLGYPITRQAKVQRILLGFVISPTIVPFSLSAFFIIYGQQTLALGLAEFGFIYIIVGISIIIILPVIGVSYETGKP